MSSKTHTVIIGNGISGSTLALQLRKKNSDPITLVSKESPYFFSRTALMYVYMGHMKWEHLEPYPPSFWKKNNINLVFDEVKSIDFNANKLFLRKHENLAYDQLVLATGSKPNFFDWPGQNLKNVRGLYSRQDLEALESASEKIKNAVVVGGGLIGVELAEMLCSRGKKVTFLVRESSFWNNVLAPEESEIISKHIVENGVDLRLSTELSHLDADDLGAVCAANTKDGDRIACEWVGIATGVSPNLDLVKNTTLHTKKGIVVNRLLETNLPRVYAIGDCAEQLNPIEHRPSVEAVWYTGRIMGETLAKTLAGNPTAYKPGHWFNSAKFFELEYQTYGWVWAKPKTDEQQLFWSEKSCSLRLAYNHKTRQILGFCSLGLRLRQAVCDRWLEEKISIEQAVNQLEKIRFDAEFAHNPYPKIKQEFLRQLHEII